MDEKAFLMCILQPAAEYEEEHKKARERGITDIKAHNKNRCGSVPLCT